MPQDLAVRQDFKLDPASMTLRDWAQLCDYLSTSDIVPDSLHGKPANIFLVIQMGQELGLPWARALQTIYSPGRGQTGIRGTLLVKNIRDAGHKIRWEEFEDGCTCRIWRKDEPDEPYEATFTHADAVAAKLTSKDNYQRYAKRMYRWRSTSDCAGFACPEVVLGFAVIEAMDDPAPVLDVAPMPPAPGNGVQAASASPVQELIVIEQQGTAEPEHGGESDSGGESAGGGELQGEFRAEAERAVAEALASPPAEDEKVSAVDRAKAKYLGEQFERMGYGGREYVVQRLQACSAWVKRPINRPSMMKASEIMDLGQELMRLQRVTPEPGWLVALTDAIAKWKEDWRDADYEGYIAYTGEEPE